MMIVISSTLVALRFISRHITKPIGWDDWFCLMSLIFAYGILVTTALSGTVGRAGYHITVDTTDGLAKFYKVKFPPNLYDHPVYFSILMIEILADHTGQPSHLFIGYINVETIYLALLPPNIQREKDFQRRSLGSFWPGRHILDWFGTHLDL